jgi:hypothetical protein
VVSVKRSQTVGCMAAGPPESMHEETQRELSVAIIRLSFFPAQRDASRFLWIVRRDTERRPGRVGCPGEETSPTGTPPSL